MDELRKTLPAGVELRLIYATSDFVKNSLKGLQRTLIEGALLTIAIVFLFLHSWRSTVITALTLPIAVISSFIAVYAFGFTLNFMTMMALSLCIGLLIDDAIVVRENIVRHVGMGKDHHTAAREGTDEIGLAVMATTFALCAVFVPVAFMGGIVGKFFYPFGITVAVAVLVSLFVSFTLDPMLSAVWRDPPSNGWREMPVLGTLMRATDRALDVMHTVYERLIRWVFSGRRYGWIGRARIVVGVGVLSFARRVGGWRRWWAPSSFRRPTRASRSCRCACPPARAWSAADEKVRQVEAIVRAFPEVKTLSTRVGGQGQGFAVGRAQATLDIALVERRDRRRSQKEVEDAIRVAIAKIPGIEASLGFDKPIYVAILGSDSEVLTRVATEFTEQVKKIPGITDVDLSAKPGLPAYAVRLKPGAVRELGLTAPQLASSLRAYVNGEIATYWTTPDGEQVEVLVRLPFTQRERIDQMRSLPVAFSKDGAAIPLQAVADIEPVFNPDVIRRQNLQRREAIFAGAQGRPSGDVGKDVVKLTETFVLPPGYSFDVGGADQGAGGRLQCDGRGDDAGGDLHLHRAGQPVRQLRAADRDHGQPAAVADRRDAGAAALALDAERVLDDRPGDADGPGDQERDPAGRLCQPRAQARRHGGRRAAAGGTHAHAADHDDHRCNGVRHAAAGAGAQRRRRDPGADGPRHHRRRHHLDAAHAGGGAGDLQLRGARAQGCGSARRRRRRSAADAGGSRLTPRSKRRRSRAVNRFTAAWPTECNSPQARRVGGR